MAALAISVLLPTIRPELLPPVVASIRDAAGSVPTEIVIVADCAPTFAHEPWIIRPRQGVVDAANVAYQAAQGQYVFLTNDETLCGPQALVTLYHAAESSYTRLLTPRHVPHFPFFYYGRFFAAFPFARRTFFDSVGGLLDPIYHGFYADPDLSMRVHAAGLPIDEVPDAVIYHTNDTSRPDHRANVAAYLEQDRATFRARWDHLGVFCDP